MWKWLECDGSMCGGGLNMVVVDVEWYRIACTCLQVVVCFMVGKEYVNTMPVR